MTALFWVLLGCAIGAFSSAIVARVAVGRAAARVRASQKRARSAERLAEIGSMTSGLAHEIKNPLSTIGLNAQLLGEAIEDLQIDEQEKGRMGRRVGALRNETDRLRGILEDFLEYAGELRLDKRLTDLNDLIEQLGDFFHVQAQSSGVQIRLDPSLDPVMLLIDANHIKQAALNLMINAVNAMKDDPESGKDLILRVTKHNDDSVSIHVTDTGPGISSEDQDRIFHPYFTTRASGTGLGLPTARRIAEAHGGTLELHSEPGKGSDFAIHLPPDSVDGTAEDAGQTSQTMK
jgi:signal transduction histidine kinase